jgi:hypothetical protein
VPNLLLDIRDHLAGISLVPAAVQVLSRNTKLDYEITRQIFRLDFTALFPPEPEEGSLIIAHNDSGI